MFKNQFTENQTKSVESARALGQTALENAQELAEINYQAAQQAVTNAQAKAAELMKSKDAKAALDLLQSPEVQEAVAEVAAYQKKVAAVLRRGNQELVEAVEAAIDQSQDDLKSFVAAATSKAPAGSEAYVSAFTAAFNTTMQNFDQVRSSAQDAFANFEKSVETAMKSSQGQFSQTSKAAKSRTK
ncbi:phasin family protein [Polynucleobacter sp. Nonnen-W13]|uniref:phasin family protein n=1 Tax=Polynucleobacter sp. Nonnen-W13 TaxID=1855625 RepID=UPI001C0DF8EE|nr:phasin family protein [Polynucleobacter sp. Nonnen-W13]MBU3560036.1 phasin family protein [Polynucleobacter sp. Nonnen-W13]